MKSGVVWCVAVVVSGLLAPSPGVAQDESLSVAEQLQAAKKRVTQQEYLLRYKFRKGETVRWEVVHKARTDTKISGNSQTAESNSVSTKVWSIDSVANDGNMRLVHSVDRLNMWQKIGNRKTVRYDSAKDQAPPPEYEAAAKTVGIPLSTVVITPTGRVVKTSRGRQPDLGLGQIVFPFPKKAVRIGASWNVPREVKVTVPEGGLRTFRKIKVRQQYTLQKVKSGIATIRVRTQVVTPVRDPKIESQLVQKLIKGTIKFDVDAGRVRTKNIEWDEQVIGFSGAGSNMSYRARFTEKLLEKQIKTAAKPTEKTAG